MPMGRSQVGCRSGSGDRASALEDEGGGGEVAADDASGNTPKKACSDADEEPPQAWAGTRSASGAQVGSGSAAPLVVLRTAEERVSRMAALRAFAAPAGSATAARAITVERDADEAEEARKKETRKRMLAHLRALGPKRAPGEHSADGDSIDAAAVARYLDEREAFDITSYLRPFARGSPGT